MTGRLGRAKIPAIMHADVVIIRLVFTAILVAAGYVLKPVNGDPWISAAVGAVIASHSQPVYEAPHYAAPPEPEYYYYDPYCGERFSSLDSYGSHVCGHHHPRIVQVISVDTGRCVHVYRYDHGRWEDQDGDWDQDDE